MNHAVFGNSGWNLDLCKLLQVENTVDFNLFNFICWGGGLIGNQR